MRKLFAFMFVFLFATTAVQASTISYESTDNSVTTWAKAKDIGDSLVSVTSQSDTWGFTGFEYNPNSDWLRVQIRVREVTDITESLGIMDTKFDNLNTDLNTNFEKPSEVKRIH